MMIELREAPRGRALEGAPAPKRFIVVEFPGLERARE
jgi:uncharacterized protein (DUF1330 family)